MDILTVIDAWQAFVIALGGAAAVLLGLTFIGVSLHLERRARALWYRFALAWLPAVWLAAGVALLNVVMGTQNAWDLLLRAAADED